MDAYRGRQTNGRTAFNHNKYLLGRQANQTIRRRWSSTKTLSTVDSTGLIVDRTTENPGEECVKVLLNVVCAYHFPFCANDVLSYDQVCFSACKVSATKSAVCDTESLKAMNDTCGITLDKFAHVGMRCNFKKIDPNNIGQVTLIEDRRFCCE
eukprot:758503-Hanusia_phi.AAC.2